MTTLADHLAEHGVRRPPDPRMARKRARDCLADHLREHGIVAREYIAPPVWTWPPVRRVVAARIVADHGGAVVEVPPLPLPPPPIRC